MRATRSRFAPLTAAALTTAALTAALTAAVRPAAAQSAEARAVPGAGVHAVGATPAPAARTVATYRFTRARDGFMPTEVTIADSAGVLVAAFRLPGDRAARPMAIDLTDADLVLQGETPAGVLTLRFFRPGDAADTGAVAGRWWLGEQAGTLRGRVTR
jgi:hypothetical protein